MKTLAEPASKLRPELNCFFSTSYSKNMKIMRKVSVLPIFLIFHFYGSSQKINPSRDWKLAVQMWTFNKFTFLEGIDKADSCGFKYIEAYPGQKIGGNFRGNIGPAMNLVERKQLKDYLNKKGIIMLAYGVVDGTDDAKTLQDWKNSFDFAKDMNVTEITVMPTSSQLDYVNELAGTYHIKAAIHDEPGLSPYGKPDSVVIALKNRANLGACVDMGNWARNGVDVVDCIKNQLKGRIFSLHLKDVKASGNHQSDVLLGQGICNIPGILAELKNQGFMGFFSLERGSARSANLKDISQDIQYYYSELKKLR